MKGPFHPGDRLLSAPVAAERQDQAVMTALALLFSCIVATAGLIGLGLHSLSTVRWPCLLYTSPSPRDS